MKSCYSMSKFRFILKNWKILWPKFDLVWCKGQVGLGDTCNAARRAIPPACCPTGAACKWERQPRGPDVGICRKMTKKGIIKQNMPFIIAWNNTWKVRYYQLEIISEEKYNFRNWSKRKGDEVWVPWFHERCLWKLQERL